MPFLNDDDKLLEKHKTIWTNIEDLKNIELNDLPVYDYRYIKTQMRTYGKRVYIYFHGLNVPEHDIKCKSFTAISIDSLLIQKKRYYLQVYLDNCAYKLVDKQIIDYLGNNLFESY